GFAHFSVHIRSREEIILRIHPPSTTTMPISSLTISEHVDKVQATEESRVLFQRVSGMERAPDLSDYALERDTGVNFLVAGYPRYKCPYVWLRTDHQRLIIPAEEGQDVEKDVPLKLESIDCWRLYDIRPWDVMVEVICTAVVPPPENPFAVDYTYFDKITIEERVVLTGALLEFLRRVIHLFWKVTIHRKQHSHQATVKQPLLIRAPDYTAELGKCDLSQARDKTKNLQSQARELTDVVWGSQQTSNQGFMDQAEASVKEAAHGQEKDLHGNLT
ncbi:hypothetical protein IW152_003947, partial [Coemansia sp. BCRC 34962]